MSTLMADEITAQVAGKMKQAEGIVRSYVERGETAKDLSFEHAVFLEQVGLTGTKLNDEFRRMFNVVRNQQIAGDAKQRDELNELFRQRERKLVEERPKIQAKIEALQKQLSALETEHNSTANRLEQVGLALERLSANVSQQRKREYDVRLQTLNNTVRRQLLDLETEVSHFEVLLATDHQNLHWLDAVQAFSRESVVWDSNSGHRVLSPAWAAKRAEIEAKLPAMKDAKRELQDRYDTERANLNELLTEYHQ